MVATVLFVYAASIIGDPHFVTLDFYKYTFNRVGEFFFVKATDDEFVLQGRLEPVVDVDGVPVLATVLTALAAKQDASDVIQFQLDAVTGIMTLVNGQLINLSTIDEQQFANVKVLNLGSGELAAVFRNGACIQVKEESDLFSMVTVSLPQGLEGQTLGLLGLFDKNSSNDLSTQAGLLVSLEASNEEIDVQFGMSCEFTILLAHFLYSLCSLFKV